MSKPINEADPLANVNKATGHALCSCPSCQCHAGQHVVKGPLLDVNLKAEHYSIALREEGEAEANYANALKALTAAEEALNDASVQTTLARADLFKVCGL